MSVILSVYTCILLFFCLPQIPSLVFLLPPPLHLLGYVKDFADPCIHLPPSETLLKLTLELSVMAHAHSLSIWKDYQEFQASLSFQSNFDCTNSHLKKPVTQPAKTNNRTPLWSVFSSALGFLCTLVGHVGWPVPQL